MIFIEASITKYRGLSRTISLTVMDYISREE